MGTQAVGEARQMMSAAELRAQRLAQALAQPEVRLTARGAVVGLFLTCFLAMILADLTGWRAITDFAFVGGGAAAAWYTKPGALLPLAVSPPIIFLAACVPAQMLTASGTFATATGIFVTLGTSAPWLFIGTALILGIALFRGLPNEIADLVANLRGPLRPLSVLLPA